MRRRERCAAAKHKILQLAGCHVSTSTLEMREENVIRSMGCALYRRRRGATRGSVVVWESDSTRGARWQVGPENDKDGEEGRVEDSGSRTRGTGEASARTALRAAAEH
eukprot:766413-Rhodomonas_salina.2